MTEREFILKELGYTESYYREFSDISVDRMAEYVRLIEKVSRKYIDNGDKEVIFAYGIAAHFSTEDIISDCFNKNYIMETIERSELFFEFMSNVEEYFCLSHEDSYEYTIPLIFAHFERTAG